VPGAIAWQRFFEVAALVLLLCAIDSCTRSSESMDGAIAVTGVVVELRERVTTCHDPLAPRGRSRYRCTQFTAIVEYPGTAGPGRVEMDAGKVRDARDALYRRGERLDLFVDPVRHKGYLAGSGAAWKGAALLFLLAAATAFASYAVRAPAARSAP
jgi:hypothetical protein